MPKLLSCGLEQVPIYLLSDRCQDSTYVALRGGRLEYLPAAQPEKALAEIRVTVDKMKSLQRTYVPVGPRLDAAPGTNPYGPDDFNYY